MGKVRITVTLDSDLLDRARRAASLRGVSLSQLIEDALSDDAPSGHDGLAEFLRWAAKSQVRSIDGKPLTRDEAHERP